jgi:thiamine-phosphate pyrophosphorylase
MRWSGKIPAVYPILDASLLDGAKDRAGFLRRVVRALAEGGVGLLQYRNKSGGEAEILAEARVVREAAGGRILLVMNDWPVLAVEAGFDGVHVGQTDLNPAEARAIVGSAGIVGVSTHNETQLRTAEMEPVDYVAIGPVFTTRTKENPDPAVGLEGVRLARGLTSKPLVAIGGITAENAAAAWGAGADSLAVISAIFGTSGDPAKAAGELLRIFEKLA